MSLTAFPADFRDRFADEMESVFADRCEEKLAVLRPLFVVGEMADAILAGARMRVAGQSRHGAMKVSVTIAMLMTTLTIRGANSAPLSRIDFNGHDPAGSFTITVVDGKAIAATLERASVATSRIIQKRDSILVLGKNGEVALAVRFDPKGEITWEARQ